tara:strand:- start:57 stop:272 length:216 start_codon:yes stop_codon:yes gene_type:complete
MSELENKIEKEMPENFSANRSRNNFILIYDHKNEKINHGGIGTSIDDGFSRGNYNSDSYSIDERSSSGYIF